MRRLVIFTLWGLMASLFWPLPPGCADDAAEAYINRIEQRIMATWKLPPKSDGLKVVLRYNLARNGTVSFVRTEKTSGNQSFDDSAVQAVRRASPFPPPPKSFPVGDLRMVLDPTLSPSPKPAPKNLPQERI
jgi:TonB family protein